jgi:hypothetical protein
MNSRRPDVPPDNLQKTFGKKGKAISRAPDALWVEVLTPGILGDGVPDVVSFRAEDITRLRSLGADHCIITEKSEWIIALPHDVVAARIRMPEEGVLDLKAQTYLGDKGSLVKSIKAAFEEAALRKKYEAFEKLTYQAFVRSPHKNNFTEFSFNGSDIDFSALSEGGSKVGDKCLTFKMRPGVSTPFGTNEFIIETTMAAFAKMVKEANDSGAAALDIRKYSLRKGMQFKDAPEPSP